ncbi:hypothetical protein KIN20_025242 [Parelaphostrongylus tenuis]|uniref:RRM domain-containing protein n=1 Tax=Parelaphostrongylus tenuis TaxID=148309 RepID=A0AAD5QWU6_PARTN|nr:hypothetical protein KIN20_025242 [Parelaphostrongylus tenuis]
MVVSVAFRGLDCKADAARSGGSEDQFQDCRIYVSNIPFSFRSRDLIRMFSPFGKVSNAEIVMNERGSKGFGFVTLDSKQGSEAARAALNGIVVNGRVIEVKKATAMPIRRNSTISRPPRPPSVVPPEPNIVPPQKSGSDLFGFTPLHQVQPHSLLHPNSATEQLNALLLAQNQLNLPSLINPIAPVSVPYSNFFVPQQFPAHLQQPTLLTSGIPISPVGLSASFPLPLLYTGLPSTPFVTPTASNQPLNAALMALSSPALGYAAFIPSVHQAGIYFQPSAVPPSYGFATKDLSNATTGLSDLLGSLGMGSGLFPSSQIASNLAQCAPAHTVCSLDQSCVIDTSLHEEPLKEGRFGPIGSAIPPDMSTALESGDDHAI